ncbi:porin family protein [Flavobacterium sp.]|uniref:porin family protein n=1 Tax=Flavobacterium sp. TaxID=239 RepID=UPI002FD92461
MRFYLSFFLFLLTFCATAQDVATDFDAVDSLYREDQFYVGITYNTLLKKPSGLRQNKFSTGLSFGFLRDMPINKNRTFSIAAGLGYSLSIYNQNLEIQPVNGDNTYQIIASGNYFSKDKISLHYVDVPVEFRWRNSTPDSHKFWRIYLGLKLSYLLYDQYKLVSTDVTIKQSHNKDLNDFQYGVYLSTGWNTWNIYAYYGLNPLFKSSAKIDNQTIDMNAANFGIMFYIL